MFPTILYPTIQSAINAATNGDTVLVQPGTYQETIDFLGKEITVESSGGASVTTIPDCRSALDELVDVEFLVLRQKALALIVEQFEKRAHHDRVELAARKFAKFGRHAVQGQALSVRSIARHRLGGIGHENDARRQGDGM